MLDLDQAVIEKSAICQPGKGISQRPAAKKLGLAFSINGMANSPFKGFRVELSLNQIVLCSVLENVDTEVFFFEGADNYNRNVQVFDVNLDHQVLGLDIA